MMFLNKYALWLCLALLPATVVRAAEAPMPADEAWKALPGYQYGQEMAPLLAIDGEVIRSMASAETRSQCAARLAALLEKSDTTLAAKQYICLQLRQVGGPAEVPVLEGLLDDSKIAESARLALASIGGRQAISALRGALGRLQGDLLVGAIHSLATRKDADAVPRLKELAGGAEPKVAAAALDALADIATQEAAAYLIERAGQVEDPLPQELAATLLRCANSLAAVGQTETAMKLFARLSQAGQPAGPRRAALLAALNPRNDRETTLLEWLGDADPDHRRLAAGLLGSLSEKQLEGLVERLPDMADMADAEQLAVLSAAVRRLGARAMPLMALAARSDQPLLQLAGIRGLGLSDDAAAVPLLIDALSAGAERAEAARQALCALPREAVVEALLKALTDRPEIRRQVFESLNRLKCYEAIDPLIAMAARQDAETFGPALEALRGIADPDQRDVPRLVELLLKVDEKNRAEVERAILIVCEKGSDRAAPVWAALDKLNPTDRTKYLPLVGRLGGEKALRAIDAALSDADPDVRRAAVRALCNWPNADLSDRLWSIADADPNKEFRQWALRAYVRVVTLKSDRPADQTLAMLKKAMQGADNVEDQQWVLRRASTVRTMAAVDWIAEYLNDPRLDQTACESIVALAHHRFLRHPNMDRFGPLLEKVGRISRDPALGERAK